MFSRRFSSDLIRNKVDKPRKLSREYVVNKFYLLGYHAEYNSSADNYTCSCPICREGSTGIGNIKRCFYYPDTDIIYCFHCGWSSHPLKWICEVSGMTPAEVYREIEEDDYEYINVEDILKNSTQEFFRIPDIPSDAIDLNDINQINYFKNNNYVVAAVDYLKKRKLYEAVNRPNHWFISLLDPIHRERLIIPFYDVNNKVVFYQSRDITGESDIRYLSKQKGTKTVFNINKLDYTKENYFIFEGPFDSCFTLNGVAVGGITPGKALFNEKQEEQIDSIIGMNRIWVLDSQYLDNTAREKSESLLELGESVFLWPYQDGKKYKDFNEMAIDKKITGIGEDYILQNTYSGYRGLLKLKTI